MCRLRSTLFGWTADTRSRVSLRSLVSILTFFIVKMDSGPEFDFSSSVSSPEEHRKIGCSCAVDPAILDIISTCSWYMQSLCVCLFRHDSTGKLDCSGRRLQVHRRICRLCLLRQWVRARRQSRGLRKISHIFYLKMDCGLTRSSTASCAHLMC